MSSTTASSFTRRAYDFTLNRLFAGDTILNWFLGALMTFFPRFVDRVLIKDPPMLPAVFYIVVGIIFLAFAAWQSFIVAIQKRLGPPALIFAAVMALVPVVLLTAALVFLALPLKPFWRAVLWVGDVYMLFLGAWYLYLAHRLNQEPSVLSA